MKNHNDFKSRLSASLRALAVCLLLSLTAFAPVPFLTGCALSDAAPSLDGSGGQSDATPPLDEPGDQPSNKLTIVCTAFPQYDWAKNLIRGAEDHVQLRLLNSQGTDMHSFQPTAQNMVSIAKCDLFIHIGGFSETWVSSALRSAGNSHARIITLLDHVDKKEESLAPGMVHDHDHNHDHAHSSYTDLDAAHSTEPDGQGALGGPGGQNTPSGQDTPSDQDGQGGQDAHDGQDGQGDAIEYDEHLWLSLRCAKDGCYAIAEALCQLDPDRSELYMKNLSAYSKKLHNLDLKYAETLSGCEEKPLLFADRFPFLYLTDDYGLTYFAAFPGCSAETEASFENIVFLAGELKDHDLHGVLILDGSKPDFARTILNAAGCTDGKILTINSMQSVTAAQIKDGVTYLSIMEQNLKVLQEAL